MEFACIIASKAFCKQRMKPVCRDVKLYDGKIDKYVRCTKVLFEKNVNEYSSKRVQQVEEEKCLSSHTRLTFVKLL